MTKLKQTTMSKSLIEEIFIACQNKYDFDKGLFFSKLGEMDEKKFQRFMGELKELIHHKDTTAGLYAMDSKPQELLEKFWQRTSDACPLEASAAEKEESDFYDFADKLVFEIRFEYPVGQYKI